MKKNFMAQTIDPEQIAGLLRECAAEIIMPLFEKGITDDDIFEKTSKFDLVTTADREVEEKLTRLLPSLYKGCVVIGEETVHAEPQTLDALNSDDDVIFVVDPIDGTNNFASGKRHFAVMMSCVINGQTQFGWIYDVLGNETTIAERGQGAYTEGHKIQSGTPKLLGDLQGFSSMRHFPEKPVNVRERIKAAKSGVAKLTTLGCAAHEYLQIANGAKDFALYTHMKPWDHLAGALILGEAGGLTRKWDGSDYTPKDRTGGLIAATNEESWNLASTHFKLAEISQQVKQYKRENKL